MKIKSTALGAANGKLGTLKHLPPTLSVVYYPLDNKSAFQPYVGAGINYTWIYDEHVGSRADKPVSATSRPRTPGAGPRRSAPTT